MFSRPSYILRNGLATNILFFHSSLQYLPFCLCSISPSFALFIIAVFSFVLFLSSFSFLSALVRMSSNVESESTSLYTRKILPNWSICDQFISNWGKSKGFGVIKDKVVKEGNDIRRRMYICEHGRKYTSNSMKETSTKKMLYP